MLLLAVMCLFVSVSRAESIKPVNLRCEYLMNPQGIDIAKPRFAWMCESSSKERGWKQMAYRILVASSPENLEKNVGDFWDSGKIESGQSTQVVYGGVPLASRISCFWKVKIWYGDKQASAWSEPAHWTMGLLKPEDCQAEWISMQEESNDSLAGAQWIWTMEETVLGKRYFVKYVTIPENTTITSAEMIIVVDDQFKSVVNGKFVGQGKSWNVPVTLDLKTLLKCGSNTIEIEAENTGGVAGLICKLSIVGDKGKPIVVVSDGTWNVSSCKDRPVAEWKPAEVLGDYGLAPWGKIGKLECRNSPMLRKTFTITKPVKQAQVSICGLGYYELFLNGTKVGDHVLDPAWTCYHKNALYVTYDIADTLKQGRNAFGVQLANGVYNQGHSDAWQFHETPWKAFPQMLLQLDIVYVDGTKERVVSDGSWKVSSGPIYWDQLRMGVMYDARREQPGWSTPAFDDSFWQRAIIREGIKGKLVAQVCEPIKVMKTLEPVTVRKIDGGHEFDFGQNIVGWSRLKVTGRAGTEVKMEHIAEVSEENRHDMSVHVHDDQFQTDVYVLKGDDQEVWEPGFTYHGFSKVKVTGLPEPVSSETMTGQVVYTSFEERGAFECSNSLLNKLTEMTLWSYIGNFVGIPTDCPHREKNGWTGDAQVACELGLMYYGSEAAYTRWVLDIQAIQRTDGKLPCIVPSGGWGFDRLDGPAWEIAYLMIPWHLYEYRGDSRILEIHYENYKSWLDWYRNHPSANKGHIIHYGLGDWVPIKTKTPITVTSTGYYYAAAKRLAAIAKMLGKEDEEKAYSILAGKIRQAFNKEFYHPDTGLYANGSQTAMSCALYHGLVESDNHGRVVRKLVDSIRRNNFTLDCGMLGSKYLLRVLSDNGHADVAYKIVTKEDTPGWVNMIKSGNTTLWETFTCRDSDNHVFLGDLTAWFISYLAGIRHDPANPGFQLFLIKPEIPEGLEWVKAHHDSPYGKIESAWKKENDSLSLNVTIPTNTTATVYVPAVELSTVTESGVPADQAAGVAYVGMEDGRVVFAVESGCYYFLSKLMNN